jgi:hypothetical protein
MGKNPAFQFYPSDWTRDMGPYSLEICGAWINILCSLFWDGGKQTKSIDEWARILRENRKKTEKILDFLEKKSVADFERLDNQSLTIISRRMVRDFRIAQLRKEVGRLGGNPNLIKSAKPLLNQTVNQKPTPSSSTSSSTSKKKRKTFTIPSFEEVKAYCLERKNVINPQTFIDHYTGNGWKVGINPMKDWKAVIRTWETRGGNGNGGIRTSRSDPRDASLQSREDAEVAAITAKWEAAKKSSSDNAGRTSRNNDAPDFQGG